MRKNIKIFFYFKAYHPYTLNKTISKITDIFCENKKQIQFSISSIPQRIKKFTVLRSPHIDKKARDQFEMRFYKKILCIQFMNYKNNNEIEEILNLVQKFSIGIGLKIKFVLCKKQ